MKDLYQTPNTSYHNGWLECVEGHDVSMRKTT